ncbi:MAG: DUF1697 domain-containing protein [Gemmatimonadota bacterium]
MPQYIAFLRGINVGGHRVKMDHLRNLFKELGYVDVATVIASGNVVFSSPSRDMEGLRFELERHLANDLGYEVATFIRTPAELKEIAALAPSLLAPTTSSGLSLYVLFLSTPADSGLRSRLSEHGSAIDEFRFSGREVYWLIQGKLSQSPLFGAGLEKALRGLPFTMRNMTTIGKLVAKLEASKQFASSSTADFGNHCA